MQSWVHFIPIVTTCVAAAFAVVLYRHWRARGGMHLLWWTIGVLAYGAGTATESATTLFGWHLVTFKLWYITGALLGGAPLAQGTVYLLTSKKTADRLTMGLVSAIVIAATFVLLSPIKWNAVEAHHLTGAVLGWPWVRAFSPFINTYAAIFLIGGAGLSAWRFARKKATRYRMTGNVLIAVGALLPGIGGTATRFGHTEVLYVTELIGLLMIFAGYRTIAGHAHRTVAERSPRRDELGAIVEA